MIPIYEWMGGKARHAEMFGYRLMAKLPDNGTYYEGFAGAASVGIWLGQNMPNLKIILTDTNPCVVNALKYMRDNGDFKPVLRIMAQIAKTTRMEDRKHLVEQMFYSETPVEWLAAANSVRPARNAWPYPPEKVIGRMALIPKAWSLAKFGLRNAEIHQAAFGFRDGIDAVYMDPPYYASSFKYYGQQGDIEKYLLVAQRFQLCGRTRYLLASDNIKAARFYALLKFRQDSSGKKLNAGIRGVNVRDEDAFFEWSLASPDGGHVPHRGTDGSPPSEADGVRGSVSSSGVLPPPPGV